jgi:hypothetical protein
MNFRTSRALNSRGYFRAPALSSNSPLRFAITDAAFLGGCALNDGCGSKMKTIIDTAKGLIGKLCWGVQWERQLNLSLSFGNPKLRIREPYISKSRSRRIRERASRRHVTVKGEWWLWIFCAYWRIVIPNVVTARGSSSLRAKNQAMACLNGQKLMDIRVNARDGSTEFRFDLGASRLVDSIQAKWLCRRS